MKDLSGLVRELATTKKRDNDVAGWLDELAERAVRVDRGTHGPKFAHSAVPNVGIVADVSGAPDHLVGTHSLTPPKVDTFCNAAELGVGVLLDLAEGDETLANQIASGDETSLRPFSNDPDRTRRWVEGFGRALTNGSYRAHALAKQIYFPVETGYHLIAPQFSSSLAHAVHERVRDARWSDSAKEARASRKARKPAEHDVVDYTRLARLKFGGAQPQNVSLLNSARRGDAVLLSCAPPVWQERLRLPTKGENALWRLYGRRVRTTVVQLRRFLGSVQDVNNVRVRARRAAYIETLVDEFLGSCAGIRRLGEPGWSTASDLPLSEQCLLDPRRVADADTPFAQMRDGGGWKLDVSDRFGLVVNSRLKGIRTRSSGQLRDLGLTESAEWSGELRNTISRLRNQLEAFE